VGTARDAGRLHFRLSAVSKRVRDAVDAHDGKVDGPGTIELLDNARS
jgi:hypothetical protein